MATAHRIRAFLRAMLPCLAALPLALSPVVARASSADRCLAVANVAPRVQPASFKLASLKKSEVRLTFVGHSTFLIESAGGIRIATDYNDYVKPAVLPEIATMNRAHNSHYTDTPEPGIKHVLRGWGTTSGAAVTHDLEVGDVRVRNVVTNIRDFGGGTQLFANSIFIFEIAGLCIAHLGHLHHTLTPKHFEQIGQIDIVLVPVDGSYTLDLPGMVEVIKAMRARLIIPMHYFSAYGLNRFLDQIGTEFPVKRSEKPELVASKSTLPPQPEILVLPGN
jgi:L-ascorbate metabolism protein UlaG (beta-lactamase superfamily)